MTAAPTLEFEGDEIVDENQRGFYMIDNELVFVFGAQIGAYGLAIYNVIKAYSRPDPLTGEKAAWPGEEKIGSWIAVHRSTVITYLKKLVDAHLLAIEPQYRADGGRATNRYILRSVKRAVALRSGTKIAVLDAAPATAPPPRVAPTPLLTRRAPKPAVTTEAYPVAVPDDLTLAMLPPKYQEEVARRFTHIDVSLALYRFAKHYNSKNHRFATETAMWDRLMGWMAEDESETAQKAAAGATNRHLRAAVPDKPVECTAPTAGQRYFRLRDHPSTGGTSA